MDQPAITRPPDLDRTISYPSDRWNRRRPGICQLRVWHAERVALVSELDSNTGLSVTNGAEAVVAEVRAILDDTDTYLVVEHYHRTQLLDDRLAVIHLGPSGVPTWSPLPASIRWLREALAASADA